jgi:GMP synthase (glutamine-hydrolysing)
MTRLSPPFDHKVVWVACALIVIVAIAILFYPRAETVNGLLVDLELKGPEPGRYAELVDVITNRLQADLPRGNLRIELGYVHYPQFTAELLNGKRPDFILLSPQNTPWYMYKGVAGDRLDDAQAFLKNVIVKEHIPVLGICGGHQFLALVFGGTVDFIDPRLIGIFPEKYPKEAISERGLVEVETIQSDPIFDRITTHPGTFKVMESHYEEVKTVLEPLVNLARSKLSEIQLIRIPGLTVYGTAFHPERSGNQSDNDNAQGKKILANFIKMVADNRRTKKN